MGNISSYSKHKRSEIRSEIKKLQVLDQIKSDQERQEKLSDYYFSTDTGSIDRLHMYHFFRGYIFQSNFSSPIEDKLIRGECKVLDIG
jgi:hypothetical protein